MKIELTDLQIREIIILLEKAWIDTGKSFYIGLSDNLVEQHEKDFINDKELTPRQKEWAKTIKKIRSRGINREEEPGAAGISISLKNSEIIVKHCEGDAILFQKKAAKGDWDKIWTAIRN